jgi:hypothetical protein
LLGFLRTNIRQIYSKFTPGHPTKTKNHLLTAPIAYFLSQCQKVSKTGPEIPEAHHQKIALLFDLIGMMMADNIIEDSEMDFCKKMFKKFGYKAFLIDEMIDLYRQGVTDTDTWEEFLDKTERYRLNIASW